MKKSDNKYSIRTNMRAMVVIVVYKYELMNDKVDSKEIFENDIFNDLFNYESLLKNNDLNQIYKKQLSIISSIEKNYDVFKKMITRFIREDWTWDRINPLTRSILLCASVELWKLDIPIVANEYVKIAKDFIPDDESYKFINVVIEQIGKEYNEIKQKNN